MKFLVFFLSIISAFQARAALPPQFSECLYSEASSLTPSDVQEMAKVSKVTYCQNQVGIINKIQTLDILKNKNVQVGISLNKTNYSNEDLMDLAISGPYLLYVDSSKLSVAQLTALAQAGVQLVIMSTVSSISQSDLLSLAASKTFIYNVNSVITKDRLTDLVTAGVQVVIRGNQSGLSPTDIVEIANANSSLVTVMP